ncbi:hypothetical protein K3181_08380 [Qipengyuania sp. YG27]|uniref:Uncharacterized protein n=1 Tax=Qipengyuania mesophila TaxID=2867246 RepID=A0ABS7JV51_9SPHN|nr:hypothetical protein [Qipengyuania mesophila]MBX7501456.1 hypothetical protein [Qipengyuania mesophila]
MKALIGKIMLVVALLAAGMVLFGTVSLLDKSYMPILAPIATTGLIAWCLAGILFWKRWSIAAIPIFALPFLPTSIWY